MPPESPTVAPKRTLGVVDIALFMVTAGCSLQWAATAAAIGPSSLVIWVLGGLAMFLPLSICVIFLSSRYPDDGGLYAWSAHAFGPFAGFMAGWTYWTGTLAFLPSVLYFTAGSALLASMHNDVSNATPTYFIGFSLAILAVSVALNVRGIAVAKWLNNTGAVARWLGTLLLVALAAMSWWRFGPATPINRQTLTPTFKLTDVIFWTTLAFCWTGPEAASFMSREIRDPQRTVPRGLFIAAPIIAAIYIIGTASILISIPAERASGLYGVVEAIRAAAGRLGLWWLVPLGAICVAFDRIGSVCLWIGALARIPTSAGLDRYLPRSFTRLHPRHGTPVVAIWTQAILVAALVVLGQSGSSVRSAYNVLIEMMIVSSMLPILLLFGASMKLSAAPPLEGQRHIWGGRTTVVIAALLGSVTTLASMLLSFVPSPEEENPTSAVLKVAMTTGALLLGGAGVYVIGSVRARYLLKV
ncbi:MAG TPA: APC family permease [Steroidobacteraceae bacterium]